MLRRFIPKGKIINDYSAVYIMFFVDKINNLPRKILNYHTPEELFEKQLDLIYAARIVEHISFCYKKICFLMQFA